ncbi:MAG: DeoR/GlpR family DNA-binding transcription regulator [Rectinemataceae bacterium]|nr:DeoR/GlpR family DNA-binding transcription regulator [Spirochaetaceae bacterium]
MATHGQVIDRREKILEIVNARGRASVQELAAALDTSEITIRRDLAELSSAGLVQRSHGGAVSNRSGEMPEPTERFFNEKDVLFIEEKKRIAVMAAQLIQDGQTVFMNSGTTTLCFLRALQGRRIRVITNNAAAIGLDPGPGVELVILGGEYREQSRSLVGEFTLQAISNVYADHTILGTNGISLEKGLTTSVYQECSINQAMIEHTHGKVIVIADSSKMGKVANFISSGLSKVDIVITDDGCPKEYRDGLHALGLEVIIA